MKLICSKDVTDQTQIKLDYSARSTIFNLQTDAENISKIELVPEMIGHRVPLEQVEIFYKERENDFAYTKLDRNAWSGVRDDQGRLTIKFNPVLQAHLLKIHCNFEDLDFLQQAVDKAEFYNAPEKLVTVYQKLISRTESYQYDAMGNRTTEKILLRKEYGYTYSYYPNSNRLKSKVKDDGSEKCEYAYDDNGNLTSKVVTKGNTVDTWEYTYDLLNQLEKVEKNGVETTSYIYDPTGFRVQKNGSQGRIDYVPLLNGEVGYRKEFQANKEYSFIYVGGQHLARVNGVIGGEGKKFFYHNDHLGSALMITDENGNKVVERDFTPFGERINTNIYTESNRAADEDDSAFTGKDWDADIGLYYYNARWYDPEVGRFTTEDSVADDPNLYGYCLNNPVNMVDPTGHVAASGGAVPKPNSPKMGFNVTGGMLGVAAQNIPGFGEVLSGYSAFNAMVKSENGTDKAAKQEQDDSTVKAARPVKDKVQKEKEQSNSQNQNNQTGSKGTGLFKDTDFELNPEVQQAISYYDDMDLYADVAYEKGIINEQEYTALKRRCGEEVTKLRQTNKLEQQGYSIGDLVFDTILAVVPGGDVLGNSSTAYAATYDEEAVRKISGSIGFITKSISSNAKYTVYELYDPNTMEVKYVGRTRQNIEVRKTQHWRADKLKNGLEIRIADFNGKSLTGLSYAEARGLEQKVYESYIDNGVKLLNRIRPLNVEAKGLIRAKTVKGYQEAAEIFLKISKAIP